MCYIMSLENRPEEFDTIVMQVIEENNINPFWNHGENGKKTRSQLVHMMKTNNIDYHIDSNDQVLGALFAVIAQERNWSAQS